jgi:hypothetical protein
VDLTRELPKEVFACRKLGRPAVAMPAVGFVEAIAALQIGFLFTRIF